MNVSQWLEYIEGINTKPIDLNLERVAKIAKKLALTHFSPLVITIAGTNGKGSTLKFLETIYRHAGYKTASYTSPHLHQFTERICVDAKQISENDLCNVFQEIENSRGETPLTYFEFTTLAALFYFKQCDLDIILLEVGLGGRLDAVNVVEPDLTIITTIDLDHQDFLGDTRGEIAKEKAGIMRSFVPCVCGDFNIPQEIMDEAKRLQAPLYRQGYEFNYERSNDVWYFQNEKDHFENLPVTYLPRQNASTALQAVSLLQEKFAVNSHAIHNALKSACLEGRFSVRKKPVLQYFDVAHNPQSASYLRQQLIQNVCTGKTYAVFSMLSTKSIRDTISAICDQIDVWYIAPLTNIRHASAKKLTLPLVECRQTYYAYDSMLEAYKAAIAAAEANDRIVVFGSFHTVAAVLEHTEG